MAPDRSSYCIATTGWKQFYKLVAMSVILCSLVLVQAAPIDDMYGNRQQLNDVGMNQIQCHPDWQWMCSDGMQCIAQYDVCDGIAQVCLNIH